ncbi:MAG: hypothetical protein Q9173_005251 [Seirophora scorigena]
MESNTSMLIEDVSSVQKTILQIYVLLARNWVSQDILNLCSGSMRRIRNFHPAAQSLETSNTGLAIQYLSSIGLLQRQTSPSGPGFAIPIFMKTPIFKLLTNDPGRTARFLDLAWLLLASAQDKRGVPSMENRVQSIAKTVNCFRDLCSAAKDIEMTLPEDIEGWLVMTALHYVEKSIQKGRRLFKKFFWRQWLAVLQFAPPAYISDADEEDPEVRNKFDSDAVDDILDMVSAMISGGSQRASLTEEAVRQVIVKALEGMYYENFAESSSSFDNALQPIQGLVNTVFQGLLDVPSEGEGVRKLVRFTKSSAGKQRLRER